MTVQGKPASRNALLLLALAQCFGAAAHATGICNARSYGAKADGTTKDTPALQRAIDDCARKGGGVVNLTRGTYLSRPILWKSHITLQIDAGATLLGSQIKADYLPVHEMREDAIQPLISATNAQDVTIRGDGAIE
jgi:polygalacturonase